MQQKAEFEKEIEKLLFDNREIKEHSRKTQRELSKEITNLTSELKDERDRIHELQKENRKLRQEVLTPLYSVFNWSTGIISSGFNWPAV